jgi:hypothetical protein
MYIQSEVTLSLTKSFAIEWCVQKLRVWAVHMTDFVGNVCAQLGKRTACICLHAATAATPACSASASYHMHLTQELIARYKNCCTVRLLCTK